MRKRSNFSVWVRQALLIAATCIQILQANAADLSATALKELTPEGYKIAKTIACERGQGAQHEHLVALADADDHQFAAKPVMLLLVAAGKEVVVEDSVTLHNDANTGKFWDGPPNYFNGLTKETWEAVICSWSGACSLGAAQEACTISTSINLIRRNFAW